MCLGKNKTVVRILVHIIFFFVTAIAYTQISDIARLEYVGIPGQNNEVTYDRFRAMLNFPIKVKENAYFVIGADYSYVSLDIEEALIPFDPKPLSRFQLLDLNLGYTYKVNKTWRFAARLAPGISSNLRARNLSLADVAFSADIVFINNKKSVTAPQKPSQLILGISISNNRGFPVLPFISYYKKFHPNWSYNLGVPKTNLQWHISERNRLKAVMRLDGFSGNLQNGFLVNEVFADRFRLQLLVVGLRYEYKLSKHIEYYLNTSSVLRSNAVLREGPRRDVFEVTEKNRVYVKTGIRFKV